MSEPQKPSPPLFEEFFNKAKETLNRVISLNRAKAEMPRENRIRELEIAAARGVRANVLVQSESWREDLLPFLQDEASQIRPWRPDSGKAFDPMAVDANYYYFSGKAVMVADLISRLQRWSDEGARAQRELDAMRKREEEARRAVAYR